MLEIKRYILLILVFSFLLSSCKGESGGLLSNDEADVIVNDNNSVIRLVAEESEEGYLPTSKLPESLSDILRIIYEPLFDFDEALNPVPVLAESVERIGEKQYLLKLKSNVFWHDGSEFGGNDVIYTVKKLKEKENNYSDEASAIDYIELKKKNELLITLYEPTMNFEGLLCFPIIKNGTDTENTTEFEPDGTGPYKFSEKSGNEYRFIKNEKWHGNEPSDKEISIILMKDKSSAIYAYEANEIDVISSEIMDLTKHTPRGQASIRKYISDKLVFLGMNNSEGILSNPKIRQAISYLIDKEDIIEKSVYGRGKSVNVPIYPMAWYYNSEDDNIEVASDGKYLEKLLNEEGWYKKSGIYTKDYDSYEAELTLSILVNESNEARRVIADEIASALYKNGIIVKVKTSTYEQYTKRILDGDYSMFIGEMKLEKNMDPSKFVAAGKNYFKYQSDDMENILIKMRSAEGNSEIQSAFDEFIRLFLNDMPFVPLFFKEEALISLPSLSGVEAPNYYGCYKNIENWYFSKKVEMSN